MSIRFINTPYFNFKDKLSRRNLILRPFSGTSIDLQDSSNSRVKNIGLWGNSEQATRSGKNRIKLIAGGSDARNGITAIVNNDLSITLNGTATQDTNINFSRLGATIDNNVISGNTLSVFFVSGTWTTSSPTKSAFRIYNLGFSLALIVNQLNTLNNNNKVRYSTYQNNDLQVNNWNTNFLIPEGDTLDNFTVKLMLTDEVDTEYEDYGAMPSPDYPSEIKSSGDNGSITEKFVNKNLFDIEKIIRGKVLDITTGELIARDDMNWCTTDFINVPSKKVFTLSGEIVSQTWTLRVVGYDKNKHYINGFSGEYYNKKTITFDEEVSYIRFTFYKRDYEQFIQLETGSTATDYELHQQQTYTIPCQQPMRAIGDVKDTFVKVDGVWYERHIIEKGVLGTENYRVATCYEAPDKPTADSFNTAYFGIIIPYTALNTNFLSNRFIYTGESYWATDKEGLQLTMSDNRFRMRIEKNKLDGYDNDLNNTQKCRLLSDYLNNNLTEVLCSRVEPLDLPCTQAQITDLEALMKARTYKNITHIYSEDEVQATLSGKYYAKC